jgi:hypothetical protein
MTGSGLEADELENESITHALESVFQAGEPENLLRPVPP